MLVQTRRREHCQILGCAHVAHSFARLIVLPLNATA